jgi:hypothetical protein
MGVALEGKLMKCWTKWYTSSIQGPSLPHSDTVVVFLSLFSSFTLQKEKSKINVCIKMDITADRLINTNIQKKKKKIPLLFNQITKMALLFFLNY